MLPWLFASLRGYRIGWLPRDFMAGLMLAAIAIPGQLATARLAGMPPETGLYAFAAGSLAFAAFGANRFMSVAADSTIAPIFAGGVASLAAIGSPHYVELVTLLALMVGAVLLAIGLLRAGWLATLLSIPVTTGFLAGIAIHIIVGELPTLLGISEERGHLLLRLFHVFGRLEEANPYTFALGAGVLAVTLRMARISSKIPGALIGIVAAGIAVALFHLQTRESSGATVDRTAAPGTPVPARAARDRPPGAARPHRRHGLHHADLGGREHLSFGAGPAGRCQPRLRRRRGRQHRDWADGLLRRRCESPSTAIVVESGGRSQIASITAVALMIALFLAAAGLMAYVPHAALAGILVYIALKIFRLDEMIRIYRHSRREIPLVAASGALVVALPIETGMLLAIVLSFVYSLYAVARPYCAELARVPGSTVWWPPGRDEKREHVTGVLVFAPAAPLTFTNAQYISDRIMTALASAPTPVKLLVIEASGMIDIDYTGSRILQQTIAGLRSHSIEVAIARLSDTRAQEEADRTGLIAALGSERVFKSVEEAVRRMVPG